MFAYVSSHAPIGIDGKIIKVEVDIRNGIPGTDIVGLPDGAVKEAKERVRVAIRNSGFIFPPKRILINLAPAGIKKEGASYDLPIALGILAASNQIIPESIKNTMVLGELNLAGKVRAVRGVLSAISAGVKDNINKFIVPEKNLFEAKALGDGKIYGIKSLMEAVCLLSNNKTASCKTKYISTIKLDKDLYTPDDMGDLSDLKGQWILKRALEIAAAGRHNLFLFGPPGCGKTMSIKRLATILPQLNRQESLSVTQIHSIAGLLTEHMGLIRNAPFRMPHHTASAEGIIGGGKITKPGEVSLAHEGILFLDEAPEFKKNLLQALREPIETEKAIISRAGLSVWFPASFQLSMTANPCPCGNLGRPEAVCFCSKADVYRYWKKMGGALLDRIDIRIPVSPVTTKEIAGEKGESSKTVRERVEKAVYIQNDRYKEFNFSRNSKIPPGLIDKYCYLDKKCSNLLAKALDKLSISSRACHSILKVARTIADLSTSENIIPDHILEAIQHRRYGDGDYFWKFG